MPGLAGIISKKQSKLVESELDIMLRIMQYETFYSSGKYVNAAAGIYAGWVVHENSFADCLPIYSAKRDIVMLFYGEHYPDAPPADSNEQLHREVSDTGNARFLMTLFEQDEDAFFLNLNGFFCGLVVNTQDNRSILFNDRFGMQRLYFYEDQDSFYFASEAKCLLKVKPELRNLSVQALSDILHCGCVLGNRSLFEGIGIMPGGARWETKPDRHVRRAYYFCPSSYECLPPMKEDEFYPKLQQTLRNVLPKYFRAHQPIALSLTGGLDTRTMLANAPMPLSGYKCYTHSGKYRDCYDVTVAKRVAGACGLNHYSFKIDDGFLADFPDLAEQTVFISDGCMDLNGAPSLYLHKKARELCSVRLTGNFGDQVLAGRINLRSPAQQSLPFLSGLHSYFNQTVQAFKHESDCHPLTFFLFKQLPWLDFCRYSIEQSQIVQRTPYMDNDLTSLLYQAPAGLINREDLRMRLIREGDPKLAQIPTERGCLGSSGFLAANVVQTYRKTLFQLEYYFGYGMPNWLARLNEFMRFAHMDRIFLDRNKYYSYRSWFRHDLSGYLKDILLDSKTLGRSFVDKKHLMDMVYAHTSGKGNYTNEINRILCLELTCRKLLESI